MYSQSVPAIISKNVGNSLTNYNTWNGVIVNVKDQAYGAKGDGIKDDTAAIQSAINYAQSNGGGTVYFPRGKYIISTTLNINHGSPYSGITLEGDNSELFFTGAGSCIFINPVISRSATYTDGVRHFEIKDFTMNTSTSSGSIGIDIGKTGYVTDDFQWSQLNNVMIQNFDTGIRVTEARHIVFESVVVRTPGTKGLFLQSLGYFCGDLAFDDCEFTSGSHSAIHLYSFNSINNSTSETRGIHFTDTDVYGKNTATQTVLFECSGYGRVLDIWFSLCALDSGFNYAFNFNIQQNSFCGFVHILDNYAVNFTYFLFMSDSSSLSTDEITVRGCQVGLVAQPFNIFNVANIKLIDNMFKDVTAKSAFTGACKNIQMVNNSFRGSSNLAGQCVTIASTVLSAIIKNNFGNYANASTFVENQGTLPATALIIADNLQIV